MPWRRQPRLGKLRHTASNASRHALTVPRHTLTSATCVRCRDTSGIGGRSGHYEGEQRTHWRIRHRLIVLDSLAGRGSGSRAQRCGLGFAEVNGSPVRILESKFSGQSVEDSCSGQIADESGSSKTARPWRRTPPVSAACSFLRSG